MRSRVSALCPFVLKYKYLLQIICRHRSPRGRASTLTLCPAGADTSLRGSDTLPACQRGTLNAGHIEPATALPRTPIGTALEIGEPNQERLRHNGQCVSQRDGRRVSGAACGAHVAARRCGRVSGGRGRWSACVSSRGCVSLRRAERERAGEAASGGRAWRDTCAKRRVELARRDCHQVSLE